MTKAPHYEQVRRWAEDRIEDPYACPEIRQAAARYVSDLDTGPWDFRPALAEFAVEVIEGTIVHQQGEDMAGRSMRGRPFALQPWQLFAVYNICGFYRPGTDIRRYSEAMIFTPRKNAKTTFAAGLLWALALWYRKSGAKVKSVSGSLKQGMEFFDFLAGNLRRQGLTADVNPVSGLRILDSSLGHSVSGRLGDGAVSIELLAYKPELFDSFNANLVHLDELHVYRNSAPYARLVEATSAYSNKLILATTTAGDDGQGFCAQRVAYARKVLDGTVSGQEADRFFAFLACAPVGEDGEVDYTSETIQRQANPGWGVTVRPADLMAEALQAKEDPQLRKDYLTRRLNVFVSSYKAWFDVEEFRRSDGRYDWTLRELARLVRSWYGGADLSKLHDLTAACLSGEIPAAKAASGDWHPPEDVLVLVPHCWFPVAAAAEKADADGIPLFGWREDGWLDMPNEPSMDPTEPVKWFAAMRSAGLRIRKVGHDRKFARAYVAAMREAKFAVVDQPQLYLQKSEGLRYIEHKAKIGCLYYLHAEPYEYCVGNVRGAEKADDAVQYDKISPTSRIDVFDASVFAVIRLLQDGDKAAAAKRWLQPEGGEAH